MNLNDRMKRDMGRVAPESAVRPPDQFTEIDRINIRREAQRIAAAREAARLKARRAL